MSDEATPLPPSKLQEYLAFALELAQAAGRHTTKYFAKSLDVDIKQDLSPVTIADRETELLCRQKIIEAWPDHGIIGEEFPSRPDHGTGYEWVIDPIDGTKSFISAVPLYTVLISLLRNGLPVLGVIHQPILGETVWAGVGSGCYYNGSRTRVRDSGELSTAWLMCTDPTHLLREYPRQGKTLLEAVGICRSWGDGYGYLMLASGRADIMIDPRMNLWDIACLKPIIEEAGGVFSSLSGAAGLGDSCLAATPQLHPQVLRMFSAH